MLAKVTNATIDPGRCPALVDAVQQDFAPGFLAHPGALCAYWLVDPGSGHALELAVWRDSQALAAASSLDGAQRSATARDIALRVLSVHSLPVLACRVLEASESEPSAVERVRLTWVEGVSGADRDQLPALYDDIVADQVESPGFLGSFWLGEESSGEGCAVSLWQGSADPAGDASSARRRRRVARRLGCRISPAHDYRVIGRAGHPVQVAPSLALS